MKVSSAMKLNRVLIKFLKLYRTAEARQLQTRIRRKIGEEVVDPNSSVLTVK